jgi:hypothetical protein
MCLTNEQMDKAHAEFIRLTRQFLEPYVVIGATWIQCQNIINVGEDEQDEAIVNPLFAKPGDNE